MAELSSKRGLAVVLDVEAVHLAFLHAANLVRAHLLSRQVTPAIFRPLFNDIPPRERDEWVDLLWDFDELPDDDPQLPSGCVPYLPCPVATVLDAVKHARVTDADVFVDVGSGLGRTAFLTRLLTGAGCIGVEIQPALVQAARGRVAWFNLDRTGFIEGDAAEILPFIAIGTVFFFYCPFGGERFRRALDALEGIARTRPIRICCVQMPPFERPWLVRVPSPSLEIEVYQSTLVVPPPKA